MGLGGLLTLAPSESLSHSRWELRFSHFTDGNTEPQRVHGLPKNQGKYTVGWGAVKEQAMTPTLSPSDVLPPC